MAVEMLCKIEASLCCAFILQGLQTFAAGFKFRDQHTDSNVYKQDCRQLEVIVPCACDWMFYHLVRAIQSSDSTDCVVCTFYFQISSYSEEKEGGSYCGGISRRCGESREAQSQGLVNMQSFLKTLSAKLYCIWCLVSNCQNICNNTTGTNFYMFIADCILGILMCSLRFMHVSSEFDVDCPISPGTHDFKAQQHGQVGKAAASPRTQGPCSEWGGRWGGEMGRGRSEVEVARKKGRIEERGGLEKG